MKKALTLALSIALLSGCSAIQQSQMYYAEQTPTAASVEAAGGSQAFNDSLYTAADFNKDGSPRAFEQYDFATESAPCAVLGKGTTYEAKQGESVLTFNCRATKRNDSAPEMRLFLVGSSADCASRIEAVPSITAAGLKKNLQCNGYRINRDKPTQVDLAFKG